MKPHYCDKCVSPLCQEQNRCIRATGTSEFDTPSLKAALLLMIFLILASLCTAQIPDLPDNRADLAAEFSPDSIFAYIRTDQGLVIYDYGGIIPQAKGDSRNGAFESCLAIPSDYEMDIRIRLALEMEFTLILEKGNTKTYAKHEGTYTIVCLLQNRYDSTYPYSPNLIHKW